MSSPRPENHAMQKSKMSVPFTITAPDGTEYIGTAPDGATDDDIFAYVQKQVMAQQPMSMADRAVPNKDLSGTESLQIDREYQPGQAYSRSQFEASVPGMALRAVESPALKLGELLPSNAVTNPYKQYVQDIKDYQHAGQSLQSEDEKRAGRTAGAVGSLAPALSVVRGATRLFPSVAAMPGLLGTASRAIVGGGVGGVTAGMQPGSTLDDVGQGALFGVALPLGFDAGKKALDGTRSLAGAYRTWMPTWAGGQKSSVVGENLAREQLIEAVKGHEARVLQQVESGRRAAPTRTSAFGKVEPTSPTYDTVVPGSHPTVGQLGDKNPVMSRVQGLESKVRETQEVGIESNIRAEAQERARKVHLDDTLVQYDNPESEDLAKRMKNAVGRHALPLKEKAINAANKLRPNGGFKGMPVSKLLGNLYDLEAEVKGNPLIEDYLRKTRQRVMDYAQQFHPSGTRMDAKHLAGLRDSIKGDIDGLAGNDRTVKRKLQAFILKAEHAVDDALDAASGNGGWSKWKDLYHQGMNEADRVKAGQELSKLSTGPSKRFSREATDILEDTRALGEADRQAIKNVMADKERETAALNTRVRVRPESTEKVSSDAQPDPPNIMNRQVTGLEWLLKGKRDELPPIMNRYLGEALRNPEVFRDITQQALGKVPAASRNSIIEALMKYGPASAGTLQVLEGGDR